MTAKLKISDVRWLAALALTLFVACDETALRDNPFDPDGVAYNAESSSGGVTQSSSSEGASSSVNGSSSSEQASAGSSSSDAISSSSEAVSSSSAAISSSSVGGSSTSQATGVGGSLWNFKTNVNAINVGLVYAPGVKDALADGSYGSLDYGIWYGYTGQLSSGDSSTLTPVDAKGNLAVCSVAGNTCAEAFAFDSDVQALKVRLDLKGEAELPYAGIGVRFAPESKTLNMIENGKAGFCITYALQVNGSLADLNMELGTTSIGSAENNYNYVKKLNPTSSWKTLELPWSEFAKPSYATHSVTLEQSIATFTGLNFLFVGSTINVTGVNATLLIADLGWKGDACGSPAVAPNFQMP